MKITAFNGSPRGKAGNTHIMLEKFFEGAKSAGAEVENITLAEKKIKNCIGCFSCWIKTPGECVIDDDMKALLKKYADSDVVIFATPLYVDNVSGIMKNFMDRLIPLAEAYFGKDKNGECKHQLRIKKSPKIVVMSNCGFPEDTHFQVLKLLFRRIARNISSEVIAEIYRSKGELLRADMFILKPIIDSYKKALVQAGREIAESLKLSEKTIKRLSSPLIPDEQYIQTACSHLDKEFKKNTRT